jgi:hypothetical protein
MGMKTTLECVCGRRAEAESLERLEKDGWRELSAMHCNSCDCTYFYCPEHAPLFEKVFSKHAANGAF